MSLVYRIWRTLFGTSYVPSHGLSITFARGSHKRFSFGHGSRAGLHSSLCCLINRFRRLGICSLISLSSNSCAYSVHTHVVRISGHYFPCSSPLLPQCKSTYSYVLTLKEPHLLTHIAWTQLVLQSLLGLLTGWGIGSAGMKAALAVRSQLLIESTLQKAPARSVALRDV
jgi:hypothetical protein